MIHIINGAKGSGKTKKIIDAANNEALISPGEIVFITDTNRYMYDLKYKVRFINVEEYEIQTELGLLGFIRGVTAGNKDVKHIYIDGAARIAQREIEDMTWFYKKLETLSENTGADFTLTVSADECDLPEYIKNYL